jgi:hypothetical protein
MVRADLSAAHTYTFIGSSGGDSLVRVLFHISFIVAMFVTSSAAQTGPPEEPAANPGRPTVSTPATLTPVGYLQFESGVLGATHSPEFSSSNSFGEVVKLSVRPRLQFIASVGPIAHYTAHGKTANSFSDVFLGAQTVLATGKAARPTVALSYFRHIYGGSAPNLDFGSPTNSLFLLASADVKGFHYDANTFINELNEGPVRRAQYGQTLSVSHPVSGKLSISGEIWVFTQPFLHGKAMGNLWALAYTVRRNVVLDGGFNRGLTGTSTHWEAFVGFTYLLPHRLW